jgi:hypothetical protein
MNSRLRVDFGLTAGDIFLGHAHLLSVELNCPYISGEIFNIGATRFGCSTIAEGARDFCWHPGWNA